MISLLKLIRYPNLIVIALTMVLMRYGIIQPILFLFHLSLIFPLTYFVLVVLSVMLIAASGYIINDYFDREIDKVNRPDSMIIGKQIRAEAAYILYYIFNSIALLIMAYVCFEENKLILFLLFPVIAVFLWLYSTTYKRQLLIGNVIVSILTGIVPFLVPVFDIPPIYQAYHDFFLQSGQNLNIIFVWVGVFSMFALIINLVREIVKDAEDFEGDYSIGRETLPVVFGIYLTKWVIVILITCIVSLVSFFYLKYLMWIVIENTINGKVESISHIDFLTGIYLSVLIILPLLWAIFITIKAKNRKHYTHIALILKSVMIIGVFYALIVRFKLTTG